MYKFFGAILLVIFFFFGCSSETFNSEKALQNRYAKFLEYQPDSLAFPRSFYLDKNVINKKPSKDWTSGFYVGNLWQLFELTGNMKYKEIAQKWTAFIEKEKYNNKTHDMGFKVFCSFGQGLKHINSKQYKDIIIKSSQTLSTRFNDTVGSIRSWDFNKKRWDFPVIIDNMMNLEMLFEATKISKDSSFHKLAVQHANTTLKNHFREDNSCFHVVDYNPTNGNIRMKVTHQGINDNSAWARGQGWAIYGYTMAYRFTKNSKYLARAEATAHFYLKHPNLREDGIPYWDFNDPDIPNAPRDVSAAALVASAMVEMYQYTKNENYLNYSKKVVNTLMSEEYILKDTINAPFILKHSTGNYPKNDEIDEPIVYADYYFLETLLRLKNLKK
ncbi:glycoside hydrolase family 88 protein [Polaribacter sp. R77954]|uniref:glycoside hydrolase family 88 protein n=1 Tax=Polaribacter sp. R77954 TaxID=3093870 RepID=UPI0037C8B525